MLSALLARLNPIRRRPRVEVSSPARIAICPPALLRTAPSARQGLMAWLIPGWHDSSLSTTSREAERAPRGVTARAPRTSGFGALDTSFQRTELKA